MADTMTRRTFLEMAGAMSLATGLTSQKTKLQEDKISNLKDRIRELSDLFLAVAKKLHPVYADIRFVDLRDQSIQTREDKVLSLSETNSLGFGIRVLHRGVWGFSASDILSEAEIRRVLQQAMTIAEANSKSRLKPIVLVPTKAYKDAWQTPISKDPFMIPLEKKIAVLLSINKEALKVRGAKYCSSFMQFKNEWKYFVSTEGSLLEQNLYRCYPEYTVTAVDTASGDFQTRRSGAPPLSAGYEYIEEKFKPDDARRVAEEAVMKLKAKPGSTGKKDLIIHPSNLWLTIHESVGHATELDRALGYEANFVGTSFATPDKLKKLRYGSELVNLVADRTIPGGLATCGYDDEGVKTHRWSVVKDGLFVDYQTTREQARWISSDISHACSYADSWEHFPIQRIPNLHLEPGTKKLTPDDMIADTVDGLYFVGDGSWSIDQQRLNFQFGADAVWEIKHGKLDQMVRDVAYQSNSVEFWNLCDGICSEAFFELHGTFYDGKGEPMQLNSMSHGCAPARFRRVNTLSTR